MKVLVLGGGGREHALCWALGRDHQVWCAPGNAGIAEIARCIDVDPTDTAAVREVALRAPVDLVVVGPEAPLVAGVADTLQAADIPVFGPTAEAARIEGSKAFAKDVMTAAGVATAGYWAGTDPEHARAALEDFAPPYVVKADGLAAGKGVRICADHAEAEQAITDLMVEQTLGAAGSMVVIEEFLDGPEVSVFGLCDGSDVVLLPPAQDFKRARDGNEGPNTGGMGAYSPYPIDDADFEKLRGSVFEPVMAELGSRGMRYVGVLYAGLILTRDGPKVLEFNARFGDPETQVVVPRLGGDLGRLLLACATGRLAQVDPPTVEDHACVAVVLASGGYPGAYQTGAPISGLDSAGNSEGRVVVFHAGTRRVDGDIVTAGGRVLAVTGCGATVADACATAYAAADRISFQGLHRRSDIAAGV
ncbi:MAG: phosphoribosylamine--glycine ligase [Nitriliruptorales bacterium]|nr:phosphoribosylamine--glycine ligase [Nitriliruptorales bacterium]